VPTPPAPLALVAPPAPSNPPKPTPSPPVPVPTPAAPVPVAPISPPDPGGTKVPAPAPPVPVALAPPTPLMPPVAGLPKEPPGGGVFPVRPRFAGFEPSPAEQPITNPTQLLSTASSFTSIFMRRTSPGTLPCGRHVGSPCTTDARRWEGIRAALASPRSNPQRVEYVRGSLTWSGDPRVAYWPSQVPSSGSVVLSRPVST
jgi:hypothetical protein